MTMRWLFLVIVVAFILSQFMRLRPSERDAQLQQMRQAAAKAGLQVRFWALRTSGYTGHGLPDSGFSYTLPPMRREAAFAPRWAVWCREEGEPLALAGSPPALAMEWVTAFRRQFPGSWVLLESGEAGLSVLWREQGGVPAVEALAGALSLLSKSINS